MLVLCEAISIPDQFYTNHSSNSSAAADRTQLPYNNEDDNHTRREIYLFLYQSTTQSYIAAANKRATTLQLSTLASWPVNR